jgi:hypothetical protein
VPTIICTGCGLPIIQDQYGFAQILCGVCIEKRFIAPAPVPQPTQQLEQLIIDMRAIGKMLGDHPLASVCEDYARRAAAPAV